MDYLQSLLSLDGVSIANYDQVLAGREPSRLAKEHISDISAGGMGLIGLTIPRGDALTVKLKEGRRLRGSIAWVAGNKSGMRFQQPVSPSDALLCE